MRNTLSTIFAVAGIGFGVADLFLTGYGYPMAAGILFAASAMVGKDRLFNVLPAAVFLLAAEISMHLPDAQRFTLDFVWG